MTKMKRFLALIPVAAFAAACGGVSPTGSSQIVSHDSYEATGAVTAMTGSPQCVNLARISLTPVTGPAVSIQWIKADYVFSGPSPLPCPAPRWTSNRFDMVVDKTNPMRAGFPRQSSGKATLTATALNGVTNSIVIDLDASRGFTDEQACRAVAGVSLRILPVANAKADVSFEAKYTYAGPVTQACSVAPVWTASRSGLKVSFSDPFRASIAGTNVRTTVTATAPNGLSGKITF
jgi:hypothetical protein